VAFVFSFVSKIVAAALLVTAAAQIRFPARIGGADQLTSSDFTYLGGIRMPTSGTDTLITQGGLAGRKVGGDVHLFLLGSTAGGNFYPDVYELDVTGLTPNTTIASAPRATLYANWEDAFNATNKTSFDEPSGDPVDIESGPGSLFAGLYYNEDTDLLYAGFHYNYTSNLLYSLAAASLDNPTGPVVTRYGPWRFIAEDQDAQPKAGTRAHWFMSHPTTGKMLATGAQKSGTQSVPWGPALYGDNDWPTTATPDGAGSAQIDQTSEYLDYRSPTEVGSPYDLFGNLNPGKSIKQFRFTSGFTYIHEIYDLTGTYTKPSLNSGIATWVETSSAYPAVWFEGTHKRGVVFVGTVFAAQGTSEADCTTASHTYYRNVTGGWVELSSVTGGGFVNGETLVGGTSKTDATAYGDYNAPLQLWTSNPTDDFTVGETITGGTSGATGVVDQFVRFDDCNHGCPCVSCATGNSTNLSTPVAIIMDPDDLNAVKANTATDYLTQATSMFSLEASPCSITTSTQENQGTAKAIVPGYFDTSTNRLYLMSRAADCTRTGNCNAAESLIHVFEISDSAPPVPFPVLPLSGAVALWSVGSLFGRVRGRAA
jgi:hypothetical protein